MNKRFLIKTIALILLEKIYVDLNTDLTATINPFEISDENINEKIIKQSISYLLEKHYIEAGNVVKEDWTVSITGEGIDWVEECNNINPLGNRKE